MNTAAQIIDALAKVAILYNNQLIGFSFHKTANISISIISLLSQGIAQRNLIKPGSYTN